MSQQQEAEKQTKRTIVLGKDWFHAIKIDPYTREDSSIPGTKLETLQKKYSPCLYDPRTHGKCCVGVYLSACGISNRQLSRKARADDLQNLPKEALWLEDDGVESEDSYILYSANDGEEDSGFTKNQNQEEFKQMQRAIIRDTFAKHNVEVVFKD